MTVDCGSRCHDHGPGDRAIATTAPPPSHDILRRDLVAAGFALGDPAHIRIFKEERRLELWLQPAGERRYRRFRSFKICACSGEVGPKLQEGDRQAPEGFYRVGRSQLNPNSRHHLSFNLGFPNAYDRQHERTGSALMVHGGCSSQGCYAITDAGIEEVYRVVEAALANGQGAIDVHAFPFALTAERLAAERESVWAPFWRNLARGDELFVRHGVPPKVAAGGGQYRFGEDAEGPGCAVIAAWS